VSSSFLPLRLLDSSYVSLLLPILVVDRSAMDFDEKYVLCCCSFVSQIG
jgi:hypothetical protein